MSVKADVILILDVRQADFSGKNFDFLLILVTLSLQQSTYLRNSSQEDCSVSSSSPVQPASFQSTSSMFLKVCSNIDQYFSQSCIALMRAPFEKPAQAWIE